MGHKLGQAGLRAAPDTSLTSTPIELLQVNECEKWLELTVELKNSYKCDFRFSKNRWFLTLFSLLPVLLSSSPSKLIDSLEVQRPT